MNLILIGIFSIRIRALILRIKRRDKSTMVKTNYLKESTKPATPSKKSKLFEKRVAKYLLRPWGEKATGRRVANEGNADVLFQSSIVLPYNGLSSKRLQTCVLVKLNFTWSSLSFWKSSTICTRSWSIDNSHNKIM